MAALTLPPGVYGEAMVAFSFSGSYADLEYWVIHRRHHETRGFLFAMVVLCVLIDARPCRGCLGEASSE